MKVHKGVHVCGLTSSPSRALTEFAALGDVRRLSLARLEMPHLRSEVQHCAEKVAAHNARLPPAPKKVARCSRCSEWFQSYEERNAHRAARTAYCTSPKGRK